MKIAGFQSLSLCDYPGKVAAVVFTQGCNLRCGFCHNAALIHPDVSLDRLIPTEHAIDLLRQRMHLIDGVVISGGEPTLQPDLSGFIEQVRQGHLRVKLDTNGTRPEVLQSLLGQGLLDFVAMDVKAPFDKYQLLTGVEAPIPKIRASIDLIAASGVEHEFRTTFVQPLLTREDLSRIRESLPKRSSHKVQAFVPGYSLDPWLRRAG